MEKQMLTPGEQQAIRARRHEEKDMARKQTQAAAGLLTQGILGEAVSGGYAVDEKTIEAIKEAQQPEPEVEEASASPPDPVDEIVESLRAQGEEETEDISAEVEQDEDEFEIPDFEAIAEHELLNEEIAQSGEEAYEPEEWEPEDNEARKRAIIAEKKAAFYEQLTARREQAKWEKEADKHFPMWRVRGAINATSHRGFLAAAKESHEAVKPFVKAAVKTREEQLAEERASMKDEVKAEAAAAWGKPTVEVNAAGNTETRDFRGEYRKARINQDLPSMLAIKRAYAAAGGNPDEIMSGGEQ